MQVLVPKLMQRTSNVTSRLDYCCSNIALELGTYCLYWLLFVDCLVKFNAI